MSELQLLVTFELMPALSVFCLRTGSAGEGVFAMKCVCIDLYVEKLFTRFKPVLPSFSKRLSQPAGGLLDSITNIFG